MIVVTLILFFMFVWADPPRFYISQGQVEKAKVVVRRIYHVGGDELKEENILKFFQVTGSKEGAKVSILQAVWTDARYTRATWICVGLMVFAVNSGYFAIPPYAFTMIDQIAKQDGPTWLTARLGTILVNLSNLLGNILSIKIIPSFGRRTLLIMGQILVAISVSSVAIFSLFNMAILSVIALGLVCLIFQACYGPSGIMYSAEVLSDSGFTIAFSAMNIIILATTSATPILFNALSPAGVFFIFGGVSTVGILF